MDFNVQDITALSRARREIAFSQRTLRTVAFAPIIVIVIIICVGLLEGIIEVATAIPQVPLNRSDLNIRIDAVVLAVIMIGTLVFLLAAYYASRGKFLAIVAMLLLSFALLIYGLVGFIVHCIRGFEEYDLSRWPSGVAQMQYDLDADIRFLPSTLYTLLFQFILFFLVFRIAKLFLFRKHRPVLAFKSILFSTSSDTSLFRSFIGVFGAKIVLNWRLLPAFAFYLCYIIFLMLALYQLIYPTSPSFQKSFVGGGVNRSTSGNLTEIYTAETFRLVGALLIGRILFWVSNAFRRLSNRLATLNADRLRKFDKRPPVLYLRSFRSDSLKAGVERDSGAAGFLDFYHEKASLSEIITRRCYAIGPVMAIADPKILLRPAGPAHVHASDDTWHDVADTFMREAKLIIVLLDDTDNLMWELQRMRERGALSKTILLLLPAVDTAGKKRLAEILSMAVFPGCGDDLSRLAAKGTICGIRCGENISDVITSDTSTISDYDIALHLLSSEKSAEKQRPSGAPAVAVAPILIGAQ